MPNGVQSFLALLFVSLHLCFSSAAKCPAFSLALPFVSPLYLCSATGAKSSAVSVTLPSVNPSVMPLFFSCCKMPRSLFRSSFVTCAIGERQVVLPVHGAGYHHSFALVLPTAFTHMFEFYHYIDCRGVQGPPLPVLLLAQRGPLSRRLRLPHGQHVQTVLRKV